jgi:ferredoxin--NADP+ reductase
MAALDIEALRREHYNATVVHARHPSDELMILRVRPDEPIPPFEAGQWISIGVGLWEERVEGCPPEEVAPEHRANLAKRPFSISSSILTPDGARLLRVEEEQDAYEIYTVLIRDVPPGTRLPVLTPRLFALHEGDRLHAGDRPHGKYTLEIVRPEDDVLFAATGTGEAPHNRMVGELLRRRHRGRIASIVTTRRRSDQAYRPAHERLMQLFPNYRWIGVATREEDEAVRLQAMLESGLLEERIGFELDPRRARVFLCGNPEMIGAPRLVSGLLTYPSPHGMVELLERLRGFRANPPDEGINIHYERYW